MSLGALTGAENTALGAGALGNIAAGFNNLAAGVNAGLAMGGNENCVVIGNQSVDSANVGNRCTMVGAHIDGSPNADDQIIIGYGAGDNIPGSDDSVFVVESAASIGANRLSFLFGRTNVGNLILGTAQDGGGLPINRDFGGGTPVNVYKIQDTTSAPTTAATAGATMYSDGGILNIFGGVTNRGESFFLGIVSPAALAAGVTNNWAPTLTGATRVELSGGAAAEITGLVGGVDGRWLILTNIGATNNVIIRDEDVLSTAANRFSMNGDLILGLSESATFLYSGTLSRWTRVNNA